MVHQSPIRRLVPSFQEEASPSWSPDGRLIAFTGDTGDTTDHSRLFVVNANGTGLRLIAQEAGRYAWSRDSRELLVEGVPLGNSSSSALFIADLHGKIIRRLLSSWVRVYGISWAPSNQIAYVFDKGDPGQDKCGS